MAQKKKILRTMVLIIAPILIVLCFVHITLPRTGTVLDAETGKPIDKAVVCCFWPKGNIFSGTPRIGGRVYETTTDQNGEYFIPPQLMSRVLLIEGIGHETALIYKDGYAAYKDGRSFYDNNDPPQVTNTVKLQRWREGVKSRQQLLMFMDFPYGDTNDLLDKELEKKYHRQP